MPLQFVALVADQCLNHCDRLVAHDELVSGARSANCQYRRGAANHLHRVEAMNPTSPDDFAHQSGQTQLKFGPHALVEQLAVAQMQVRLDELNRDDDNATASRFHSRSKHGDALLDQWSVASSQRSQSIAAMHPEPAAVMAWR